MLHGQTVRNAAKTFLAFATLGMATACSDTVSAPPATEVAFTAPAAFNVYQGTQQFTIDNRKGGHFMIGNHGIYFPANSICDPSQSSYGQGEWDKPCKNLRGSQKITAVMLADKNGNPYVDFQPALRFNPATSVYVFLKQGVSDTAYQLTVEYCNASAKCENEALTDPSLATLRYLNTSVLYRRIKHFSGYSIAVGDACDGLPTGDLTGALMCATETLGFNASRRSGYMVASGLTRSPSPEVLAGAAAVARRVSIR
jgi:hypothetical protein